MSGKEKVRWGRKWIELDPSASVALERSGFENFSLSYNKKQETIQGPAVLSTPRTTMCPYLLEGRKDADVGWRCRRCGVKSTFYISLCGHLSFVFCCYDKNATTKTTSVQSYWG